MRSKHIIGVVLPLGEPDWPSDKDDALTIGQVTRMMHLH